MKDLEKIKKNLSERLAELKETTEEIEDALEAPGDDDFEEMAVEAQGDEVLETRGNLANEEIRRIKLALKRIESGDYGTCGKCEMEIPLKRLEALPYANLCVDCQNEVQNSKV